jgi:hypothetical protein
MAFGDKSRAQSSGEGSSADVYMKLGPGEKVIRILDEEETVYWRYWINKLQGREVNRSVTVASMRDPIPRYYNSLGKDHPEYRSIQKRFVLNVLDRTPMNADPSSKKEDKVRILELGKELMDKFAMLHMRIRDRETFEPLPITRFDVKVISQGTGKDVNRIVLPGDDLDDLSDELKTLLKFDLSKVFRPMPAEYQERLLAGEDYADVIKDLGWEKPVATIPIDDVPF